MKFDQMSLYFGHIVSLNVHFELASYIRKVKFGLCMPHKVNREFEICGKIGATA
jgi:hypothetical protein